mgnify:CR=1 FL=1
MTQELGSGLAVRTTPVALRRPAAVAVARGGTMMPPWRGRASTAIPPPIAAGRTAVVVAPITAVWWAAHPTAAPPVVAHPTSTPRRPKRPIRPPTTIDGKPIPLPVQTLHTLLPPAEGRHEEGTAMAPRAANTPHAAHHALHTIRWQSRCVCALRMPAHTRCLLSHACVRGCAGAAWGVMGRVGLGRISHNC